MQRSVLMSGAVVILAAFGFACAPIGTAEVSPLAPQVRAKSTPPCSLSSKTYFLAATPAWDPMSGSPPPLGSLVAPNSSYATDLDHALAIAPEEFQNRLCSLDAIVLDQGQNDVTWGDYLSSSYGLRNRSPIGHYVVLSIDLWTGSIPYTQFETNLLGSLLPLPVSFSMFPPPPPPPSADSFAMTLLAALAHEVGHIRWYDIVVPRANGYNYDFSQLACPGGTTFFTSWHRLAGGGLNSKPRFRELLTLNRRTFHPVPDLHQNPPQIKVINNLANGHAPDDQVGDELDKYYLPDSFIGAGDGAPWASFFAALSPDEDFVETYKLAVLMQAKPPLTSLQITMPGTNGSHVEDIPRAYLGGYKNELAAKVTCVLNYI